jgi:hypothetical protein
MICVFLALRVHMSSRTRDGCHPRALFYLFWGVTDRLALVSSVFDVLPTDVAFFRLLRQAHDLL